MKKLSFFTLMIAALAIVITAITSCQEDDLNGNSGPGKLVIKLTDAPFPTDLVAEANVTIEKIEIRKADEEEENPFIVLSEQEETYNLLDLTNGVTASLADLEIEAGSYDLIRLYVSEASIKLSNGIDTTYVLKVPSGNQTGIKIFLEPSLEVAGGLTSELLLDVDVSKSFVLQGNIDTPAGINGFIFTPSITASNLSTAGRLTGTVTGTEAVAIEGAQVSIFAADTVYKTSFTEANGAYTVLGVDAGTYKVTFAKDEYETATVENVSIVAANATEQDAQLTAVATTEGN